MTPNMGMAAPKGTQAPAAGLAALAKPNTAAKGKSPESMGEIMSLARKMSDAQLADVLAGKSLDVPQFAAMTEAMGRKSLRTAMQGQQAMQQNANKPPSVKDQLLGEYQQTQMAQAAPQMGGIAGVPAPNMESMDMASGGIVAFEEGGETYFERMKQKLRKASESAREIPDMPTLFGIPLVGAADKEALEKKNAPAAAPATTIPPVDTGAKPDSLGRYVAGDQTPPAAAPQAPVTGVGTAAGNQQYSMPNFEQLQSRKSTDYLSRLEGLSDKQRAGLADLKKQGGGEALMQMAAGILSRPTLGQGLAAGLPMVASTASATRKEARAVENAANEFDFNMAKAREAAEQGDMALALQYTQLANQNKYQEGMLDVHRGRNAIMGEGAQLGKVQLGLANADKQAYNEAKTKFPILTKSNQAAFDDYIKKRSMQLKMQNPLTKPYANLGGGDLGGSRFNTVQSLPKGASVIDLED